jgi:hypothetical protein
VLFVFSITAKGNDTAHVAINNYGRAFINQLPDNPSMTSIDGRYFVNARYSRNTIVQGKGLNNFSTFINVPMGRKNIFSLGQNYSYSDFYFGKSHLFNTVIALHFKFNNGFALHWGSSININYVSSNNNNIVANDGPDPLLDHWPEKLVTLSFTHSLTLTYKSCFLSLTKNPENKLLNLTKNAITSFYLPFQFKYMSSLGYHISLNNVELLPIVQWKYDYSGKNLLSSTLFVHYKNQYILGTSWDNLNSLNLYGGLMLFNALRFTGSVSIPLKNYNNYYYPITSYSLGLQYVF